MSARRRSARVTVLVFAGLDLPRGAAGAAMLWRYASQPFNFYTAGYEPLDFRSVRIESPPLTDTWLH